MGGDVRGDEFLAMESVDCGVFGAKAEIAAATNGGSWTYRCRVCIGVCAGVTSGRVSKTLVVWCEWTEEVRSVRQ